MFLLGLAVAAIWARQNRAEDELDLSEIFDPSLLDASVDEGRVFDDPADRHRSAIAPAAIE